MYLIWYKIDFLLIYVEIHLKSDQDTQLIASNSILTLYLPDQA